METNDHLSDQIRAVDTKVTSILGIIRGNSEFNKNDAGMLGKQDIHEKRLVRIEKIIDRGIWFFIGLSIFAGWGLVDILQKFFLKQ